MEPIKPKPELLEGPEAFKQFDNVMGAILSVSHNELLRREKEYQRQAKRNAHRRGPKKKGSS